MAAGLIPIGAIEAAGDITTGAAIGTPGSASQTAVDQRVAGVASDIIADNPGVIAEAVALAQTDAGLARVTLGKNLFDPLKRLVGYSLNSTGNAVVLAGYSVSDYIPVKAAQPVAINSARNIELYNASKVYISGSYVNNPTSGALTVTPTVDGFIRTSVSDANLPTFQVEYGSTPTSYQPFQRILDPSITIAGGTVAPLTVTRSGSSVVIGSPFGSSALTLSLQLDDPTRNGVMNFLSTSRTAGVFHTTPDSVAPQRSQQGTIGANHGFAFIGRWASHDKTAVDLGSVWTDGTREYVILKVDGTGVWVGGKYTTAGNGSTSSANVAPAADLTHVSGATHTAALLQAGSTLQQMYPAIGNRVVTSTMDAAPLASGRGNEVVIRETYEILDYASLYDLAKANIGVPYTSLPVAGAIRVESEWRIRAGLKMLGWVALTELTPTALGQTGFFQCEAMDIPAQQTRWVPGVKTVGGLDWSAGVPLSSVAANLIFTTADLHKATVPPTMLLDWREDAQIGFAMGYEPWKPAESSNAKRLVNAPTSLWDLRSTRKIYPNAITSLAPGWGRVEAYGYRSYITATEKAQILTRPTDALAASAALRAIVGG